MSAKVVAEDRSLTERLLDGVEKLGNKVPHPVLMFLYLIGFVIILSQVLDWAGVNVTETIAEPVPSQAVPGYYEDTVGNLSAINAPVGDNHFEAHEVTIAVKGLLDIAGIRFIFTTFVSNLLDSASLPLRSSP